MVHPERSGSETSVRSDAPDNRQERDRGSSSAWAYVIARTCAQHLLLTDRESVGLVGGHGGVVGTPAGTVDPFLNDFWASMAELSQQQRAILLADLADGGLASAARLALELHTSRNVIYVARNAGCKAVRAALLKRGHSLGYGPVWSPPSLSEGASHGNS